MAYSYFALGEAAGVSFAESVDPDDPPLPGAHGMIAAAIAQVERYAPDAPEAVRQEAIVRLLGYQRDGEARSERSVQYDAEGGRAESVKIERADRQPNAFYHSGASSLLAPWRVHGAGIIDDEPVAASGGA